ncbi:MAG: hypothetical protein P8168_13385, partial [Deltaproteobacteria bacterium]
RHRNRMEKLCHHPAGHCPCLQCSAYPWVVLFCDKTLETHRKIIKEAMEIGIYACLLPPYEDWEILTMVSYYPRLRSS